MRSFSFISIFILSFLTGLEAQQLFTFTDGALLPDYDSRVFQLEISPDDNYDRLELILDVKHTWVNDLELSISNPAGEKIMVFSRLGDADCFGCDGDDLVLTFSDHSAISYDSLNRSCSTQPAFGGTAQAMESLDALLSSGAAGNWSIEIKDYWPQEDGFINDLSLLLSKNLPPSCTSIIYPEDQSENILINDLLEWESVENATGYLLNLGTESGVYDLYEELDLAAADSFKVTALECDAQYFVQILPYNDYGIASSCNETTFFTEYVVAEAPEFFEKCYGDSITLKASGSTYYRWTPSEWFVDPNIAEPVFFGNDDLEVTVTVSNENACSDSLTINIYVNIIEFQIDTINHVRVNQPGFIEISVDGLPDQFLYAWTGPDGFTSNKQDIDSLEIGCYALTIEDVINGCLLDTLICVDDLTHAVEKGDQSALLYFPNPFDDKLFIKVPTTQGSSHLIQILSVEGQVLFRQQLKAGEENFTIATGNLPPGLYLLCLKEKGSKKRQIYPLIKR